MAQERARLRELPAIDEVLRRPEVRRLIEVEGAPRWAVIAAVREEVEALRQALLAGTAGEPIDVAAAAIEQRVAALLRPSIRAVINATGVVVHTNLGRAPIAARALARIVEVSRGYCNLEYDLEPGRRGSRHDHLRRLVAAVCGAEDAVVANNNAAAVLLAVSALAAGRDVIVSRGELVEIGGGFRIPEVIVQGGARLREVGTTNRTRAADYEAALGPETGALLKVHRSNFDVVGFTEEVDVAGLAQIARAVSVPLIADLGSGAMTDAYGPGLGGEPVVAAAIAQGADLVCVSGDKLLGGPQAGLVLGRADLVARVRRHPLMRALRPCKLTLAALEATLELWRDGRAAEEVPVARMLATDPGEAGRRTRRFARRVIKAMGPAWRVEVREVAGRAGGGAMPLREAPGWAVALWREGAGADRVEAALRHGEPPVIARIVDDRVLLDLRTVAAAEEGLLLARLGQVAAAVAGRGS